MKYFFIYLSTFISINNVCAQTDPVSVWMFRMEQFVKEKSDYNNLCGNEDGYPNSAGLLTTNDTIRFQSGKIFRTCEVSENCLHGEYKMYYPSGQLYIVSKFNKNFLVDSSIIFNKKGEIEYVIKHISSSEEQKIFYDINKKIKKIDYYKLQPTNKMTFRVINTDTNEGKLRTIYFDLEGSQIDRTSYYKLHPEEKE